MRRWVRRLAILLGVLLGIVAAALLLVDTDPGHRFVADRIGEIRTGNGLRFHVGRIDGSLYSAATLSDVRVYDPEGLVFRAPRAELDWRPFAWFRNRLEIRSLHIPQASLLKPPHTIDTGRRGPVLPDFDIAIDALAIDRLDIAPRVTGVARRAAIRGRADIRSGRALVRLAAIVEGSDRLALTIDAEPDRDRFDIDVRAAGSADGVLARLTGIRQSLAVEVAGDGRWARWTGRARVRAGNVPLADLRLVAAAGRYSLAGTLVPAPITRGKVQRLTAPRVAVDGTATFESRRLDGRLRLRSAALAAEVTGLVDLGTSAFRNLRIDARLRQPPALFGNMTGRGIGLRAILDGPFRTARFDYRLFADRIAFDQTGFEAVRAAGRGRLGPGVVTVPLRLTAARVTGVGDVAGGILRNLSVAGDLKVGQGRVTGNGLQFRSDKLAGRATLVLDLVTGRYDVALNGALGRYLIPGLGVVDVRSTLRVVPGPGGRGTRIVGEGSANVLRLDNAFFRSLAGGLPRIVTQLERGGDGVLYFRNLRLVGPEIRLAGNGYRRRDGTFHFEGGGTQTSYGPLSLVLDGRIGRPTIDLVFASPNAALGLAEVRAHLDPNPEGFAFRAAGQSRLGPFAGEGQIRLPSGGQASIAVARLDVAGSRLTGELAIVAGGFDGELRVAGGGLTGVLGFRPVDAVQRIEAHLQAANATLAGTTLRRGKLDAVMLLDPAGTSIEATASGAGLARGALRLGRFAGHASLRGGTGEVRASIAGSRGRAFDIQTVTQVTPDAFRVSAQGTLDRRPIRLLTPALVTREGDAWRLAPTRLSFAGGEAAVSARFGADATALDATLTRMPLTILDIGYPGLGLGGLASGKLSLALPEAGAPTGRMDLTIRGLTRSGLVASSRPIDMGVAGVLGADRLGLRAVMASGGRTVGRAQALLRPLGTGSLAERIAAAPLFAQLRYDGPADTLWRLTGIELFDLSGPVALAADVGGRIAGPSIRGVLTAKGARIESGTTGTVLSNVQATGRFGGSRLQIDRFAADAGRGGRVAGSGWFDFAAPSGVGMDLSLEAIRAVMIDRDDFGATVTGPLRFRSDGEGGTISGAVRLDRSRYRLGRAATAAPLPRVAVREINAPEQDVADEAPRSPWRLDLQARAPGELIVSGLGLSSEWAADLHIAGQPDNPAISGQATLVRGDVEFAGREFDLERGIIRFAGEQPANPALDIEADADAPGLSATIRVTGTALKPEIGFSSVPALPEDELLSRLLFGTSITNLSAPEALQLAAAVAALQDGGNGLNPINAVRRAAGLDRLRILPADPQTGQGTSVAAGKYVTRRLYAEIVTDGQGYSATRVEFQVTRWLSLLSSISTLGRQSANVRVSKDY